MSNSITSPVTSMKDLAEGKVGGGRGGELKLHRGAHTYTELRALTHTSISMTHSVCVRKSVPTFEIPEEDGLHSLVEYINVSQGLQTVGRRA